MFERQSNTPEVAIILTDSTGKITHLSEYANRVLMPQCDMHNEGLIARLVPELKATVSELFYRAQTTALPARLPSVQTAIDGEVANFSVVALPMDVARNMAFLFLPEQRHEGERVQAIQELQCALDEVRKLEWALNEVSIVAVTDHEGVIQQVNDRFCELAKYTRDELVGNDHRIINSGHHSKEFMRSMWTTIQRGEVWKGEVTNRAKDGSLFVLDTAIVPFLDVQGRPFQYVTIRTDVTDRKKQELARAVQQATQSTQSALENLPLQICIVDLDGIVLSLNNEWREFMGECGVRTEMVGHHISEVGVCRVEDQSEEDDYLAKVEDVLAGRREGFDVECACKCTGIPRWFSIRTVRFQSSDATRVVVIRDDVTESKIAAGRIEKQLEELKRWYQATLGREKRTLELKREVNLLLASMGRPAKYSSV